MTDVRWTLLAAHRSNLERYRRITTTPLTDVERFYVKRRMKEERQQIERLEQELASGLIGIACSLRSSSG